VGKVGRAALVRVAILYCGTYAAVFSAGVAVRVLEYHECMEDFATDGTIEVGSLGGCICGAIGAGFLVVGMLVRAMHFRVLRRHLFPAVFGQSVLHATLTHVLIPDLGAGGPLDARDLLVMSMLIWLPISCAVVIMLKPHVEPDEELADRSKGSDLHL